MAETRVALEPVPEAPPLPQPEKQGESYWDLVLRQFRRNRLAVASFFFVLMLSLVAVYAPFLANSVPIVIKAAYPGAYNDRFEEWKLGGHPEFVAALRAWQANPGRQKAAVLMARL